MSDTTSDRRTVAIRMGQACDAVYGDPDWGGKASPLDAVRAMLEAVGQEPPAEDDLDRIVDAYNGVMEWGGFDSTGEACAYVLLGLLDAWFGYTVITIPEEAPVLDDIPL